ncbi:MAG: hypothetical protein JWR26_2173 [Pedosphaera sp.]|nr:hypothetical protein [Pedosphaera sp.]
MPFSYDGQSSDGLTSEQLKAIAGQILGSWKFWAGVAAVVAITAWGAVEVTKQFIDQRAKELEQKATNQIAQVQEQISHQISNQISAEFQQPRIRATIEQVASDRANDLLTNAIRPSLESFQAGMDQASAKLTKWSDDLAKMSKELKAPSKDIKAGQPQPTSTSPAALNLLTLVDHTVTRSGTNYVLVLLFKPTGGLPIGPVDLVAGTYRQTAKVLNFVARNAIQSDLPSINDAGDAARLKFTASGVDAPILVEIDLSGPTVVKLVSDVLDQELTLPVAVDKLQLPSAAK